ncbi:MAG: class III lanthionine synthetase LanKC [Thermoanaerobaculia bacterium]
MSRASFLNVFTNPIFFETIDHYKVNEADFLVPVGRLLREEWNFQRKEVWFNCTPPEDRDLPMQGWKIHVSSSLGNALDILNAVVPILYEQGVSFKFALDSFILSLMNGKLWGRQGAGKFITIYPMDEQNFIFLLRDLHEVTKTFEGLYILSDRRYKDSKVLFYRYGGIRPLSVSNEKGEEVSMLVSPTGERVPDERKPFFYVPDWARDPFEEDFKDDSSHQDEEGRIALKEGRYLVKNVIGFSNSGGVYIADDTETGEEVIIKEARPFVTFSEDAISLLKKEYRLLSLFAGEDICPRPIDLFQDWEHYFLVQELINGLQLRAFSTSNNITLKTNPTREDTIKFFADFKQIFIQLARILQVLHEKNVVFADISPSNIIILSDPLRVRLIDFEAAYLIGVDTPALLFTLGFAHGDQMYGEASRFESDYFALGAMMHYFLAPINEIFGIAPRSRFTFVKAVVEDIGFPQEVYEMIAALLDNAPEKRPKPSQVIRILEQDYELRAPSFLVDDTHPAYQQYIDGICEYCTALAEYERKDRLFPAYAAVFDTNPLSLAYGACGVAHAIRAMGKEVPERVVDWILQPTSDRDTYPPGLYIGLAGIAWTVLDLGRRETAQRILALSHNHPLAQQSFDLFHGVAGAGLANLKFFLELKDELYLTKAIAAGELLIKSRREGDKGLYWTSEDQVPLGLAHGPSGISLFLLYLYFACGREEFLDSGIRALDYDLNSGVATRDGGLSWRRYDDEASIIYPYWRFGSAGIGMALVRYYSLLGDERYRDPIEKIFLDLNRKYAVYPGLFIGLAGVGETLLDFHRFTGEARFQQAAYRIATGLSFFRIERDEGLAFPGDGLIKICCDLATGSAGVGRFFHRLIHGGPTPMVLDELLVERCSPRLVANLAERGNRDD